MGRLSQWGTVHRTTWHVPVARADSGPEPGCCGEASADRASAWGVPACESEEGRLSPRLLANSSCEGGSPVHGFLHISL